jgi:hypothetical protein
MKANFTISTIMVSLLAILLFAIGCKPTVPPTVAMVESSVAVSYDKACLVAEVVSDGGGTITEYGFCYGKLDETPDTLLCSGNESAFSIELSDLSPSTVYTCRAFARNERGRGYSDVYRFTTLNAIDTIPLVDTYTIKDITHCSAVPSGQVLSGGGQEVMERGICYGTEPRPTIEGMYVALGSGIGPFECQLTDLLPETRYYICAYAVCTKGVYYGDQLSFDTKVLPLAVRTISVSDVTASRVKAEGEVIRDGGFEVTERGFCWGTEHNPTIEGLHIKASVGMGAYSYYFSGLEKGQTHYVRAYAVNEEGVAYGDEVEFVPDDPFAPWPGGVSPGLFTVGEGHQVRFSQGNLQYCPDDNIWRFAEHQWDFVGGSCWDIQLDSMDIGTVYAHGVKCDNTKIYRYYSGWVDLFGWGTSGWDNGNIYYKPYDFAGHIYECAFYGPPGNFDLTGDYAQSDWGVYNTISNGGSRQWRTPTAGEIDYLLRDRSTSSGIRYAKATVAGVRGLVVLPDDWSESTYRLRMVNVNGHYLANVITAGEWLDMLEPAGAVFLPAAGCRFEVTDHEGIWYDNEESTSVYISGSYWTSSQGSGVDSASALYFEGSDGTYYYDYFIADPYRTHGNSVRLVSDER